MIEITGTITVLAIVAATMAVVLIKRQDKFFKDQETADLTQFAGGLNDYIIRTKHIPDETTWAEAIASIFRVDVDEINYNKRNVARIYLIDPAFGIGPNNEPLPYTQGIYGSKKPQSPRLMILSSMGPSWPIGLTSGVAQDTNTFNSIWNTPEDQVPTNWPANWTSAGKDLVIQRVNLATLFKHVVLNNYYFNDAALFAVDEISTNVVPTSGVNAYYIYGTLVGFHDTNILGEAAGPVLDRNFTPLSALSPAPHVRDAAQFIEKDSIFNFELSTWRGKHAEGTRVKVMDMELAANLFLDANANPNRKAPSTQTRVFNFMVDYLTAYCEWANAGFPTQGAVYNAVKNAQVDLEVDSKYMIFKPGEDKGGGKK